MKRRFQDSEIKLLQSANRNTRKKRESWLDWFERTGFLFNSNREDGYYSTRLDAMAQEKLDRPAYGAWAIALGEFDSRYRGPELAVSVPRAQNSNGILTGKVACRGRENVYGPMPIARISLLHQDYITFL